MTQISLNFTNELHSHLIVYFFIGLNLTIIVIIVSFTTVHFQWQAFSSFAFLLNIYCEEILGSE